ncbi:hypothetical protein HMPREF9265_0274 [Limosilactobacillus oris PB013-T2-3]|uniref:Uncharacterized protein n=1 Tax=Limosilactobacillus oris PB013-T2-3 TaxID=908339 RepID=E3C7U2_9LACO|nr:hypothetical protein HMPREF9265_0274 [Limosilactobacillus oris PB013-T2-3]
MYVPPVSIMATRQDGEVLGNNLIVLQSGGGNWALVVNYLK